ncbi:MAG: Zn-ribbon domain-containing OB-fold protein [Armatimonadota bacterium]|nr:Zn-ribbon domain-containing OB-fold protein [Armatimonadota bacterium]
MPLEPTLHVQRLRAWRGTLPVASRYTYGPAGERFFRALKDEARLLATRCGRCGITYVPGRLFCERCFDELNEWIEVGPAGTVEAVTTVHWGPDGSRLERPVLLALVRPDGADTVLVHYLGNVSPADVRIGLRVRPAFKPPGQRTGSILDIVHFTPA